MRREARVAFGIATQSAHPQDSTAATPVNERSPTSASPISSMFEQRIGLDHQPMVGCVIDVLRLTGIR